MTWNRRRFALVVPVFLLIAMVVACQAARADTITYTLSGTFSSTATVTLGGTSVAGDSFTFTLVGDTADAAPLLGDTAITAVPVSGTFTIGTSSGTFSATDSLGSGLVFGWNGTNVGLNYDNWPIDDASDIVCQGISTSDPSYDGLNATTGALACSAVGGSGTFATSDGNLVLSASSITGGEFTATTPEPSSLLLLGIGLLGLGVIAVWRKNTAEAAV